MIALVESIVNTVNGWKHRTLSLYTPNLELNPHDHHGDHRLPQALVNFSPNLRLQWAYTYMCHHDFPD